MKLNEKIKKYRIKLGLSQEALASKIYVSRTMITKYEGGSVFPTEENLKKLAEVFGIDVKELLTDEEKNQIVEKSYNMFNRFWTILNITIIAISAFLLIFSVIPFYEYSSYDYSNVTITNPTPIHVTGFVSIISATLKYNNFISLINIILLVITIIISSLSFVSFNLKIKKIIRIISVILFISCLVLFFFSFASMISIVSALDFHMNSRN